MTQGLEKVFGVTPYDIEQALAKTPAELQAVANADWPRAIRAWLIRYADRYPLYAETAAKLYRSGLRG